MTIARFACLCLLFLVASCTGKKDDKGKKINLIENSNIKLRDKSFDKYYNDQYYSPYIVRLDKNTNSAFIQVDSVFGKVDHLDKNTREDYYKKALSLLSKDEIEAHKAIWAIPEMRQLQEADGGNGTIVTWIKEELDHKSGYYIIDVKRNDVEQLSQMKGISSFRIRLRPRTIDIADESGYFVSLTVWKRART